MEKEFVPYDRSLRLKVLGFDEPCLLHVTHYGEMKETRSSLWMFNGYLAEGNDDEKITIDYEFPNHPSNKEEYWKEINIPTFSQAFRWFREKYGLVFNLVGSGPYYPSIALTYVDGDSDIELYEFDTYEEAELACLDKLIEIVENKSTQNTNDGRTMEKLIESNRKFDEKNNDNVKYDSSDRNEDLPNITNFFI